VLSSSPYLRSPHNFLDTKRILLSQLLDKLDSSVLRAVALKQAEYKEKAAALGALSPLAVLSRGYGVSYREDGRLIKSAKDVKAGDKIKNELSDGVVYATVNGTELKEVR